MVWICLDVRYNEMARMDSLSGGDDHSSPDICLSGCDDSSSKEVTYEQISHT